MTEVLDSEIGGTRLGENHGQLKKLVKKTNKFFLFIKIIWYNIYYSEE